MVYVKYVNNMNDLVELRLILIDYNNKYMIYIGDTKFYIMNRILTL